jgi:hypothetical protein
MLAICRKAAARSAGFLLTRLPPKLLVAFSDGRVWAREKSMNDDNDDETLYVSQYDGSYFGFVYQGQLYNADGREIGTVLFSKRIIDSSGAYIGELRGDRILSKADLKGTRGHGTPVLSRKLPLTPPLVKPARLSEMAMPEGYERFPDLP